LRPVAQSVAKLAEVEIPKLESGLKDLEGRSSTIQVELRDLEESIEFLKNEEDIGKKAHPDIIQLDAAKVYFSKKFSNYNRKVTFFCHFNSRLK